MSRVAVLTSGGDAPGMNAAIRAIVRTGVNRGMEVYGIPGGYTGLLDGKFSRLGPRDVGGIIGRGGTILGTSRCEQLRGEPGQRAAVAQMHAHGMDCLIVIGGSGSQAGAYALCLRGLAVVGIASTIDNDLRGVDVSIGATAAVDVALEAIDRLRVTAASHKRVFLVEVMGRDSGHLALAAGIAGGAEAIVVPEVDTHPETVAAEIHAAYERGKNHAIVVVAEGSKYGVDSLRRHFQEHALRLGFELRETTLGHVQRGAAPGVFDRMIATQLGARAIETIADDRHDVLLGIVGGTVHSASLATAAGGRKPLDTALLDLASVLAR